MSRYKQLYRDKSLGWPLGGCVTIQQLYHDKRTVWAEACHDTINCIVTGEQEEWPLAVSRYNTARAAIWH